MIKLRKKLVRIVTILSIFLLGVLPSKATIYPITEINDGNLPAGLPGSIREAINFANVFSAGLDTIDMSAVNSVATISELPFLASDVLIIGPNGTLCTINGILASSVLTISNTGSGTPNVELRNLAFQNGFGDGGGLNIQNSNVILNNCLIANNFGSQNIGGGIRLTNSNVQIFNSTISNNLNFGGIGGGIATSGECSLLIQNSTIFGNRSAVGGGFDIINPSNINVINCTVTNNLSTGLGGGFYINAGFVQLNNSIVVNNDAQSSLNVGNDIKVNPDTAQDRVLSSFGHNIIDDLTGFAFSPSAVTTGNIIPTANNSVLDFPPVLNSNGGATPTVALNACSQAIDTGNDLAASSTDQRGTIRVNTSDIGAFEYPALIPVNGSSCGPLSVQLSVSGGSAGPNAYNWFDAEVGGNLVQSNSAIFNTPILNATTTYYVAEAAACANPKRYAVIATIFPIPPTPTININGQPTTICDNALITLNAEVSQGGLQFLWSPSGQNTQSITVSDQASYTVTVISAANCSATSAPLQINVVPPPPIPTIFTSSGSNSACQGAQVALTSSSTFPNVWSTGATTQQITVNTPGVYTVTTSSAANCSSSNSFTFVNFPTPPTPVVTLSSGANPFCFGSGNSVVLSSDIAPSTDFTLLWPNGQTTQTATFDTTGDYSVILTDQNNCTVSSLPFSVIANVPVVPSITASGDTTFCDGLNVTLTSSPAASYSWSVGGNTENITVSTSQIVTVTTIDANGCEATSSPRTITNVPNVIPVISPAGPITICEGQSVVLTSNVANGNLWSTNETTSSIEVTTAGFYSTILDGCSLPSIPVEVFVNSAPLAPIVTADGPLVFCQGGSVNLTALVGTGDLIWSNNVANTNIISVTESGSYSVIETNGLNCSTASNTIVVTVNPLPTAPVISAQSPVEFCEGGSVTLLSNINDVVWSNGISATGITVSNSGSFSAVVTDANLCTSTSNVINVIENVPTVPTINANGPLVFCDGSSVSLSAVPTAISYNWSNGGNQETIVITQTTQNLTVTTTDANGCSATSLPIEVTVNPIQTPTISPSANVSFCDGGSVVLTSSSVSGNLWSTGETTQSITISTSQTVTVQVQGCSSPSNPVEVTVNPIPATPIITSPTSFINCSNLAVELTSSLAAGYSWSNGLGNNQTIQVNQAGDYSVTIFDNNSCSATSAPVSVSFNQIPATPQITTNLGSNTICTGGSLTLSSNYTSGNLWSTGETAQSIVVTVGGTYSLTHQDINGCVSLNALINIIEVPAIVPTINANGPLTFCEGGSVILTSSLPFGNVWSTGSDGPSIVINQTTSNITVSNSACNINSQPVSVVVNTNPAVPTISPSGPVEICEGSQATLVSSSLVGNTWSNGQTVNQINVTESGNYSLIVTNAEGCTSSSNVVSVQVFTFPSLQLNNINECANSVVISAGNPGSTYLWSNGEITQNITVTSSIQNLTVEITNICGTFVSQPIDVTISPVPVVNLGGPFSSCINPVILDAGNVGSTYLWNGGQTTQTISATSTGQYSVIVTNAQNCSTTAFANVIIDNSIPIVNLSSVSQCGGSVVLDATNEGATYLWSPSGETTPTITITQTTNPISVAVTNSCGTTTSSPISVTINSASIVNLGNDISQCGGTVVLDAGVSGVDYVWTGPSGAINQNTQTITVAQSGLYTVTITDANACNGSDQILVNLDNNLPVANLGNNVTQCGGTILLNAQNQGATYLWNNGATTQTINVTQTSSNFVEVTNGCGTTTSAPVLITINSNPIVDLGADIAQCGGSVDLNSGITGATSYSWSGPSPIIETTQTISVSQTGTYSVVVIDANGCSGTDNIFVNLENTIPIVNLGSDISQCGGSVLLNAGNPGSIYVWSNGATTQTITVSESGNYFVAVTSACGTTLSQPINVSINPSPLVNILNDSPVCNTTVTLDAGNPGSTFLWTPGNVTTQEFVALTGGQYTVVVTNAFNCSTTQTTQVIIDNNVPIVNLGNDIAQCGGQVTLDAGNTGASYLWNFNNAQTQSIQVNQSGTYNVDVTNACGTGTGSINVEIGTTPVASISQNINGCNSVILSVGTQPIGTTFNWNNGAGTNPTFEATASGTYSVIVTNSASCSIELSTSVTIFNQAPVVDLGTDIISCSDVTLNAQNPGSTYLWSNGATTQTIVVSQSTITPISVSVTNACGTTTSNSIEITISPNLPVDLGNNVSACNTTTLDAGTQPTGSTFVWSNANGVIPGTNQTIVVTESGTYSVLVSAPNGCTGTDNIIVTIDNTLPIVNIGDANQSNCGTLTLNAGNAGATYLWSTGATTQSIDVASSTNNITVDVTNGCGTTTSNSVNVEILTIPAVDLGPNISQCGSNLSVTLDAGNQPANSTFVWFNGLLPIAGANTQTITVTQSGIYSVVVTGANTCTNIDVVLVSLENGVPVVDLGAANQTTCGTLTLDAGNTGATYLWSTGETTQTIVVSTNTNNISVTVTNSCGSTTSLPVNVSILPALTIDLGPDINQCGGTLSATLTIGNIPQIGSIAWFNGTTQLPETGTSITVTQSGVYSVIVTVTNGCTGTDNVLVSLENNLPIVDLGASNQTNCGTLTLNAGNAGATYLWSTGATTQTIEVSSTTNNITVAVTNGCGTTTSNPVNITIIATPIVNLGNDITQCDGTITLDAGSGASNYAWTGPNGPIVGGSTITINQSGTYSVIATFGGTCSATDTIIVNYSAQLPQVNLGGPFDVCFGTITLNAQNVGSTYLWNDLSTNQTLEVSTSGTYTVTVTNTCGSTTSSAVVNILNATPATIVANGPTTFCQGSSVVLTATPGATYSWFPNGETTQSLTVSTTGVYTCTVTYANGCSSTTPLTQVNVEQPAQAPTINANGPLTFCQGGSVVLTSSNPLNNVWSNGSFAQSIVVFNSGDYTVSTVVGACSVASLTATITSFPRPSAIVNTANPATFCKGDTATLLVSSPTGEIFQWFKLNITGNDTTALGNGFSQAVFESGNYYVLVTDTNGCTNVSFPPTNIVVRDSVATPRISQDGTISPCNNKGTITLTSSSASNNLWSTGATTQSITVETAGSYFVTVSNGFCSKNSNTIVVDVTPGAAIETALTPKVYVPGDNNISVNGGSDGEIDLTVTGGVTPFAIQWQDSSNTNLVTTEDITGLKKGWYKVIVTDANGCSAKDSIYLKEPLPFKLPEGFTPNGDGKNDFFVIGGVENYPDNKLTVYNRWGNVVYNKDGYKNEWDGNANNGESMAEGTYFVTLEIPGRDLIKGFVDLRR
jgi:large repetitive protein